MKTPGPMCLTRRTARRAEPRVWTYTFLLACVFPCCVTLPAQQSTSSAASTQKQPAPLLLTLREATERAQANEPAFAAAQAESRAAHLDRWNAAASMLPTATYHNQATYTQQAGGASHSSASPLFIASNGVHEYASQAVLNESVSLARIADVRRANATAARMNAELEIAHRGLRATVSNLFYGLATAENKRAIADSALRQAVAFTSLTKMREEAREAAHADLVKAQLVEQQRRRDLADAQAAANKARLELAVLVFADPRTDFALAVDDTFTELPTLAQIEQRAGKSNPELRSAQAALAESNADVLSARAAYIPELNGNFTYGIDAAQFAVNAPDHTSNLGHSASITIDLPVWDWLSTARKVRQSEIRRSAVRVALTAAQKRLIAHIVEAYDEATTAHEQLASLGLSVQTAQESLRLTELRYKEGEASVLEVVDAQTTFIGAENAQQDGRARYQAALADLQTLTGQI